MLVLHQLTIPMFLIRRQVMLQVADKTSSKVVLLVTKVALLAIKMVTKASKVRRVAMLAICTVAQTLDIRATLDIRGECQDTRVAACLGLLSKVEASPLSKVATHPLTKAAILAMVANQATKANQAAQAITQVHHPMRGGTDQGGITSRTLLEA